MELILKDVRVIGKSEVERNGKTYFNILVCQGTETWSYGCPQEIYDAVEEMSVYTFGVAQRRGTKGLYVTITKLARKDR